MVQLTTKYDKVRDESRKKVFLVRGDESYVRTVDVDLTYTTPSSTVIKGFCTDLTVNVYRHIGDSTLIVYDDEQMLGSFTTHDYTSSYTLDDVYLSYGVPHELYAVYLPNQHTLRGKSKTVIAEVDFPESLKTNISLTGTSTQIDESATLSVTGTVKQGTNNVADNTPVKIYLDGDYKTSVNTSSGGFTAPLTNNTKGTHTVTAEVEASDVLIYGNQNHTFKCGYNLEVTEIPTYFFSNTNNYVKILVTDVDYNPISGASVSLASATATTDNDGIASFNFTNPVSGTYQATYGGSSSEEMTFTVLESSEVSISKVGSGNIIGYNRSDVLKVTAPYPYADVTVTYDNGLDAPTTSSLTLNGQGGGQMNITGKGDGEVTYTASFGGASDTITLYDYAVYMTKDNKWGYSTSTSNGGIVSETSNGMLITVGKLSNNPSKAVGLYPKSTLHGLTVWEFDIIYQTNPFNIGTYFTIPSGSTGKTVKLVYDGTTTSLIIDGEIISTSNTEYQTLGFTSSSSSCSVKINNIKYYRGVSSE